MRRTSSCLPPRVKWACEICNKKIASSGRPAHAAMHERQQRSERPKGKNK